MAKSRLAKLLHERSDLLDRWLVDQGRRTEILARLMELEERINAEQERGARSYLEHVLPAKTASRA
ncbi:hypothetical protein SY88_12995 [Clostridiales bacterium PH28_bin88]|nr:hypothetical protein SY88_12995 [Clostridiales bacterium PH28_bin88]